MAFASSLPRMTGIGSHLARRLKATALLLTIVAGGAFVAGCQNMGADDGRGTVVSGPNGRSPRPDVHVVGQEGGPATGAPRRGGGAGMGPVKIAILIPESGRGKDLGGTLLEAAQMALFDTGRSDITLIIKDTGALGASGAAQSAINEGAEIILGPIFSDEVGAVRSVAASRGVPVIAFSSDTSAAGGGAYLLSFPPEEEIRAVVNYSASQGMGLFAVLTPQDAYARRATAALERDVAATGGHVVATATYGQGSPGYDSVMQLDHKDFDALFIPDGKESLRRIATLVRFGPPAPPAPKPLTDEQIAAGVQPPPPPPPPPRATLPNFVLLGTGLWDDPGNGSSSGLAQGIFAAPEPSTRESFSSRFNGVYGHRPPRIASLGYDAMSLAATLSDAPLGQRFSQAAITDPNGFGGVDGIFRFLPDGTIQRGLAIIQINGGGFAVVRAAPRTFQSIGS